MLDDMVVSEIKKFAKKEGYKIPSKGDKNKLISAIKKEYHKRNQNKT